VVKNHPKSSIVTLKKHPKTLRNLFFFRHPKIDFYFWTKAFGTRKNGEKHPNSNFLFLDQTNWRMQKSLKNAQKKGYETTEKSPKSLIFMRPKNTQISLDHQKLGTRKNR
jgi:hypothetical protein